MNSDQKINTWYSTSTQYTACSVECCHHPDHGHIVGVGTYQLCQETGTRLGQIVLGLVNLDNIKLGDNVYTEACSLSCSGVLDMKWSHHNEPKLAVAEAGGDVVIYEVVKDQESEGKLKLKSISRTNVSNGLCLALEWSFDSERIVISDSLGCVTMLTVSDEDVVAKMTNISNTHGFEAWTVCLSKHDTNIFYSGGDDCKLNCYDLRSNDSSPVRSNKSSHSMGVTSMVASARSSNVLVTGSYDEHVRMWDVRNLRSETSSYSVGGGVWRLKPKPEDEDVMLVAAMHDGFKIAQNCEIVQEFREHESLAYGADWVADFQFEDTQQSMIATCSFYDCLFKTWSLPCKGVLY